MSDAHEGVNNQSVFGPKRVYREQEEEDGYEWRREKCVGKVGGGGV